MSKRFKCPVCDKRVYVYDWNFCPHCGIYFRSYRIRSRHVNKEEFLAVLQPLIDLNGHSWLARKLEINERRIRQLHQQKKITLDLAERWLDKLGLELALYDGTITIIQTVVPPEPPPTPYFEE